jgi:hypothetical protein
MQRERHELRERVRRFAEVGVWGWMAERRERMDFETLGPRQTAAALRISLADNLTVDERRTIVHDLLASRGIPLADAERDAALSAAARRLKKNVSELTAAERADAIAQAEEAKLNLRHRALLATTLEKARAAKEDSQGNLVLPGPSDLAHWESGKTRIHKGVVSILQQVQGLYSPGFDAKTYQNSFEGDHGSSGFRGRFRSVDLYPRGGPSPNASFGFFNQRNAYDFALAIQQAASAAGGSCMILYNDWLVAREVNKTLGIRVMTNVDNVNTQDRKGVVVPVNLNWHGPLVTHFHVDFAF